MPKELPIAWLIIAQISLFVKYVPCLSRYCQNLIPAKLMAEHLYIEIRAGSKLIGTLELRDLGCNTL